MRLFAFVYCFSATMVLGQALPNPGESGVSWGICDIADDMDTWLLTSANEEELEGLGLHEEADRLFRELAVLCRDRPSDESIRNGSALPWLLRADSASLALQEIAAEIAGQPLPAASHALRNSFSRYAHRLQSRLNASRALAYTAVKIETVEVVREVQAACAEVDPPCERMHARIPDWSEGLFELLPHGYVRPNNGAMEAASRVRQEMNKIADSGAPLGFKVLGWIEGLETELDNPANTEIGNYRLTEKEIYLLETVIGDMKTHALRCWRE